MRKILACLILLSAVLLASCGRHNSSQNKLFEYHDVGIYYGILVDKETNVCYLEYKSGKNYGITVMLNPDGTPKLWED